MSSKNKQRTVEKIRFSIGAKLVTIISFIVIISLGSITALVSWLIQGDVRLSAEDNNFEMNRRSAMEADITLESIRSNSRMLIQTITVMDRQDSVIRGSTDFFFSENPQIGAVFFIVPGREEQTMINRQFFSSRDIDERRAASFFNSQRSSLARAVRGETLVKNAAPHFSRSILALFFPWQNGGVGGVLFSSETMNNNFGFGVYKSFMLNNEGDVLSHADFDLIKEGANVASMDFIRSILDSEHQSWQQLIEADFGVLQAEPSKIDRGILFSILEKLGEVFGKAAAFISEKTGASVVEKADAAPEESKVNRHFVAFTKLNTAGLTVVTSIEYDTVFESITATTRRNIYLTIAVLCISIIFIWFFSKTISVPLRSLAFAAQQITDGVFDLELYPRSRDEIGFLTYGFQKMCSALNIFSRFTNREIAIKAMKGEIKPGGLPKHGTIFFSDIRDFTAKTENFTRVFGEEASNKVVTWLNHYFTKMIDCVEKTNGVVDKFIGDAVMAHWGTAYTAGSPKADAFNCVKAALMMRKELYFMNQERKSGDSADPPIRIGCGINTGIITAGQLGSNKRMEYTVIGDPVNLASRIETLTKVLGADILISEDTWDLVSDKFITEEMPSVTVKGKEKPVRIFAVVNFLGETKGPQSMEEVRSLLGIETPDLDNVDVNAGEEKAKIVKGRQGKK